MAEEIKDKTAEKEVVEATSTEAIETKITY